MVTEFARDKAKLSQRSIYDERYSVGLYDRRSAVRVLTAERDALDKAMKQLSLARTLSASAFSISPTARAVSSTIGSRVAPVRT